jgi:hypothetical protein
MVLAIPVLGLVPGNDLQVIFKLAAQAARVPVYPASAQTRRTQRRVRWVSRRSGRAAILSWTDAAVITTSRTGPVASTAMCACGR